MLLASTYVVKSFSSSGKPIDFTKFVVSMSINWGLNASRATAKISFSPQAKPALMNVKRGSPFTIEWGYAASAYTKVTLFWIGTSWGIGGEGDVSIDLTHKSWELNRTNTRAIFKDADAASVVKKLGKEKGVTINTTKANIKNGSNKNTIAVNQPAGKEIARQVKGNAILQGYSGNSLEIVSLQNIRNKSQAYYIDTEKGYLDSINISYTAQLPKDQSFVELVGGDKAVSAPNANPSKSESTDPTKPPLPKGNYALLSSSDNSKVTFSIIVDGKSISSYSATAKGKVKNGDFTISSRKTEIVTKDFTVGFDTVEISNATNKALSLYKIKQLKVNLNYKVDSSSDTTEAITTKSAELIVSATTNKKYLSNNAKTIFNVGDLRKLFVAAYLLKNPNTAQFNLLVADKPVNINTNNFNRANGYTNTTNESSTATDVANVFKDIYIGTTTQHTQVKNWLAGKSFQLDGEFLTKAGTAPKFFGASSVITVNNDNVIMVIFAETLEELREKAQTAIKQVNE